MGAPAVPPGVRAGVLGAVARGMSLTFAARAGGTTVATAERVARDAGWPGDMTAVYALWRVLRGGPSWQAAQVIAGPAPCDCCGSGVLAGYSHAPQPPTRTASRRAGRTKARRPS